ncbi:hypothetical protein [Sodalis ligni]|uniref:hypothetical protein n=1 Tax=Sodalis ligni TaxID=2697027 RepID=UPI00104505F8|nr:hypothetical protein [Sodalis ligni]
MDNGAIRGAFVQLTTSAALLGNIAQLAYAGQLRVIAYPLAQARNALEQVAFGHGADKVLVSVQSAGR